MRDRITEQVGDFVQNAFDLSIPKSRWDVGMTNLLSWILFRTGVPHNQLLGKKKSLQVLMSKHTEDISFDTLR
jgi:hypothetical protein